MVAVTVRSSYDLMGVVVVVVVVVGGWWVVVVVVVVVLVATQTVSSCSLGLRSARWR